MCDNENVKVFTTDPLWWNPSHRWIFQTKCQLWGKGFYGWPSTWPEYWKMSMTRQDYLGNSKDNEKLEQLECLRSEDTPRRLMITHTIESYRIPSKINNRSRTENVTEWTRFSKSRSNDREDIGQGQRSSYATHPLMVAIICGKYGNNRSRTENLTERTRFSTSRSIDLEDIGQGQRSSHATHLLMLVIICTKYGKNPSRTVDGTERTQFSRPMPNDLEDIGQGQRSLYATHPFILVIICAKYGKNPSRTVDFIFKVKAKIFLKICQKFKFPDSEKNVTRDTPSNDNDHLCKI